MKKLGVLLLVRSIEYFDHLLLKIYVGNGFEKSVFIGIYIGMSEKIKEFFFPLYLVT